jgi:hypothetical protein
LTVLFLNDITSSSLRFVPDGDCRQISCGPSYDTHVPYGGQLVRAAF